MFGKADCFLVKYHKNETQLLHTNILFLFAVYLFERQVNEYSGLKIGS